MSRIYYPASYKKRETLKEKQAREQASAQAHAAYWSMVKGFEELREKFAEDEKKRRVNINIS